MKTERTNFAQHRDKNNDGFLDKDEIKEWILPQDYDHADAEAKHLIYEADKSPKVGMFGVVWLVTCLPVCTSLSFPLSLPFFFSLPPTVSFVSAQTGNVQVKLERHVSDLLQMSRFLLQDDQLSVDEIVEKYDLFAGSQATNYGEVLNRHEEF